MQEGPSHIETRILQKLLDGSFDLGHNAKQPTTALKHNTASFAGASLTSSENVKV